MFQCCCAVPEQIASQHKGWGYDERISERLGEQTVDLPVPQVIESVEMQLECVAEQITDLPVPQILGERVQNRTPEQTMVFPVPQFVEERAQNRTPDLVVDVPVPQIVEECVQNRTQEQIADSPVPQFMEAAVENCVGEQISDSFVPQFIGAEVEITHATPQERMQTRTLEQTAAFPVPQISEERVPYRSLEQIMDFPVSQNMEAYAGRVRDIPLERVQHHSFVRQKRVFVDFLPLHKASKSYTGKVFTVNLRHHRDDQAFSDNVGLIKGLDKHNTPRFGDVMVPPPQINKVSWFDRKPQAAADEPLYRFYQRYSGRSGRSKLKR